MPEQQAGGVLEQVRNLCLASAGVAIGQESFPGRNFGEIVHEIGFENRPWFSGLSPDRHLFVDAHLVEGLQSDNIFFVLQFRVATEERGALLGMYFIKPKKHYSDPYEYDSFAV